MNRSPFEIFGLSADIVDRLSYEQIMPLIEMIRRYLQKIYHPDVIGTGNAKYSSEINEAFDVLSNKGTYDIYKQNFIKSKPYQKKLIRLSQEYNILNKNTNLIQEVFIRYLTTFTEKKIFSIFNIHNSYVKIYDYVLSINNDRINPMDEKIYNIIKKNPSFYFEFYKDKIIKIDYGKQRGDGIVIKNKYVIGFIKNNILMNYDNIIKSFVKDICQCACDSNNSTNNPIYVLNNQNKKNTNFMYSNIIPENKFKKLIPFLSPYIERDSFMVSIIKNANDINFVLDGKVIEYNKIKKIKKQ